MRGSMLTVELIGRFLRRHVCVIELFEPSAPGRIANSSELCVGLYSYTPFIYFPVENGGSSWNFWELATEESGQLEVKGENENMPLVDRVTIVAEVYGAVCQLHLRLWSTTVGRHKSSVVTKHVQYVLLHIVDNTGKHDIDFGTEELINGLSFFRY